MSEERSEGSLAGEMAVRPPPPHDEALQDRIVYVIDENASALQPTTEVRDQPQLICERELRVALASQLSSKSLDVTSERSGHPDDSNSIHSASIRLLAGSARIRPPDYAAYKTAASSGPDGLRGTTG